MQRNTKKMPSLATLAAKQLPHTLFPTRDDMIVKHLAPEFLQHVIDANWPEIELMLAKAPALMIEQVDIQKVDDLRIPPDIKLSGLKYICLMRDMYGYNICKAYAPRLTEDDQKRYNNIILSLEADADDITPEEMFGDNYEMEYVPLLERWLNNDASLEEIHTYLITQTHKMLLEKQAYPIQPYYWVGITYQLLHNRHNYNDPLVTDHKLNTFWSQIDGFVKKYLLPAHMRKEMLAHAQLADGANWFRDTEPKPAGDKYPVVHHIRDWRSKDKKYIDIHQDSPGNSFGIDYSINSKGAGTACSGIYEDGTADLSFMRAAIHDPFALYKLNKLRCSEFMREWDLVKPLEQAPRIN